MVGYKRRLAVRDNNGRKMNLCWIISLLNLSSTPANNPALWTVGYIGAEVGLICMTPLSYCVCFCSSVHGLFITRTARSSIYNKLTSALRVDRPTFGDSELFRTHQHTLFAGTFFWPCMPCGESTKVCAMVFLPLLQAQKHSALSPSKRRRQFGKQLRGHIG